MARSGTFNFQDFEKIKNNLEKLNQEQVNLFIDACAKRTCSKNGAYRFANKTRFLTAFGGFGQQGYGYNVPELHAKIGEILCVDKEIKTILIGAGNLGKAITNKMFSKNSGFKLIGIFDKNEAICGNMIKGIPVRNVNYLENFCIDNSPTCAVTCIPSTDMEELTDLLVKVGIKSFLISAIMILLWLIRV